MTRTISELSGKHLPDITPAQAADVIRYYDQVENAESLRNNWKRKVSLGQVALHTAMRSHSILPGRTESLLNPREAAAGLDYIQQQSSNVPEVQPWPVEPTDGQWEQIYRLSDTRPCSVSVAYGAVMDS